MLFFSYFSWLWSVELFLTTKGTNDTKNNFIFIECLRNRETQERLREQADATPTKINPPLFNNLNNGGSIFYTSKN